MAIKHLSPKTEEEIKPYLPEIERIKELEGGSTRIYLFNVTVRHNNGTYENKNILYFCSKNAWFIELFILENRLSLSHIFCHVSNKFDKRALIASLSTENNAQYLVSDRKLPNEIEELNNGEDVEIADNLTLHPMGILTDPSFENEMKTFEVIRNVE